MEFSVLWDASRYADGDAKFAHSFVDKFAIVLIVSYRGSYSSLYVAVPSVIDDILCMDTPFLTHMDYEVILEEGKVRYQHMDSYQGLNNKEKI